MLVPPEFLSCVRNVDTMRIAFGVFLSPEILNYSELEKRAKYVDRQGFDSIWISDHLQGIYATPSYPRLESWTALTALAAKTSRVKLGHLTLAVPFRNPALLAKMATTLDVISEGRAILSIGAGWHEREFKAFGYKFGNLRSRSDRLEEAAAIIKKMMTEEKPSYSGEYYSINVAYNNPRPVQKEGVPLMIAGEGEKRTLRTCALYGDMSNYAIWRGTADEFRRKTEVLEAHCLKIGRDPDEILKTWPAFTFIDSSNETAKRNAENYFKEIGAGGVGGLIGSPEVLIQRIYEYIDAGARMFILSFLGPSWREEVDLFMDKVVPEFGKYRK
jgi:F420-dependent oxidoreductase-like protein